MGVEERVSGEEQKKNISQVLEEMSLKMKECERNGHPNAIVQDYISEYRIRCICPDCRTPYTRYTTEDEKREFERTEQMLSEPMTI